MKPNLKLFLSYLKILLPYWDKSLFSFLCVGISVLFSLVSPLLTKVLIDYVYPNRDLFLLTFIVIFGLSIYFFDTFFSYISQYLDTYIHQSLSIDLRKRFFTNVMRLPLSQFYEKRVGDLMVRITDDIDAIVDLVSEVLPTVIKTFFRLSFLLAICWVIDRNLTLLSLVGVPLYFVETRFFAKIFADVRLRIQKQSSEIYGFYQEKMRNIKTIKSFNREVNETNALGTKLSDLFTLVRENLFLNLFNAFFDSTLVTFWGTFLGWYAGYRVISGQISIGEVIALLMYLSQIHKPFMDFGSVYKVARQSLVSIIRVNEILSAPAEIFQDPRSIVLYKIAGKIRFEQIGFRYPNVEDAVLKGISLNAVPGEVTAIAGVSGAGKSTLVDLIMRFIIPSEGEIYIDDINIRDASLISLRANISIISQEVVIFSGTVRENLQYGCIHPTEEKMIAASRLAEIHEFILSLPNGYDTLIGEGGIGLSGGELQRLAIARALLRNVKILIMDEATSAVDAISEANIYDNLKKHAGDKTMIVISHRISTLHNADKIYVISNNRISESGKFEELLSREGDFYTFYQAFTKGPEAAAAKLQMIAKEKAETELELSPEEKEVLRMFYETGISYDQIAYKLGLTADSVGRIFKSANEKIENINKLELEK